MNPRGLLMCGVALLLAACEQNHQFDLPPTSNTFGQQIEYNNKVDLIFLVDNSHSMQKHQENLSRAIPGMIDSLVQLKMDFHIAVVSSSMGGDVANGGRFIGSPAYLTDRTPELAKTLAQRILLGQAGSNLERGLESLQTALGPTQLNGIGKGFWRDDALLVVLALTDEDDKSSISSSSMGSFLTQLKPAYEDGSSAWIFNTIGVPTLTTQCQALGSHVEPSLVFNELSAASGGITASICAPDFSMAVSNINARIVQVLTDYTLNKIPVVETIRVFINGAEVAADNENGWQYLADRNVIRFHGSAVPPADAQIVIDFKPAHAN